MSTLTRKQLESRVDTLGSIVDRLISELTNLKDLSIGTMQVIKKLPGYDEAIEQMKQELKQELKQEENGKENTN